MNKKISPLEKQAARWHVISITVSWLAGLAFFGVFAIVASLEQNLITTRTAFIGMAIGLLILVGLLQLAHMCSEFYRDLKYNIKLSKTRRTNSNMADCF